MKTCAVCGGPMRDLFSSSFCPNDCDRPKKAEVQPVTIPKGTIALRDLDDLAWFGKRTLDSDHFLVHAVSFSTFRAGDSVIVDGRDYYAVQSVRAVHIGGTQVWEVTFKRINVIVCP